MDRSYKKLRGFTLLELIIAMAIIAVLCAIIIPNVTDTLRTNRIINSNSQAKEIYLAAQDYLVAEQLKGVKTSDIADDISKNVCWIAVRTDVGNDSSLFDTKNKTTIIDSYNIKSDFLTKNDTSTNSKDYYRIADGIENRMEQGFKGSWVVAFYPKTFTVAYVAFNDFYATAAECNAAVKLIGTNNGTKSDSGCDDRLYETSFSSASSAKKSQEKDLKSPDSSEAGHAYTGQFPVPGPKIT